MKKFRILKEDGISLLEVLMAMIIFSIGMLGLTPLMINSIDGNAISRDNAIVANLIKQQIESYEGLDSIPGVPFEITETGLRSQYTRLTTIMDNATDSLIPDGLLQIDVQVTWDDIQNLTRTQQYSTFLLDK